MNKKTHAIVQIHFDGDIAENHQIPMRTLGKSVSHIQHALDRAYLDIKNDKGVKKYARMTQDDFEKSEFLVQEPKEGGYILKFLSKIPLASKITDRVTSAIDQVKNADSEEKIPLKSQYENRKTQISKNIIKPLEFKVAFVKPSPEVVREYGDRSIAKEIDQVLSIIRADYSGDSQFELTLTGSTTTKFNFKKNDSIKFHELVSRRKLGPPVIYEGTIDEMGRKSKKGKFVNSVNGCQSTVHFSTKEDFVTAHPYSASEDKTLKFIGCPLIEFGALEPDSGDIYYLKLVEETKETIGAV